MILTYQDGVPDLALRVIAAGRSLCTPAWSTHTAQTVPFFRIYYLEGGAGAVTLGDNCFSLDPGFVHFIPGNTPFVNHCPKGMDVYWLHGVPTALALEAALAGIKVVRKWSRAELAIFANVLRRLGTTDPGRRQSDGCGAYALTAYIVGEVLRSTEGGGRDRRIPPGLRDAVEFMNRSFLQNPPLAQIARAANYAPGHLHRLHTRHFGITPHEYMEQRRMNLAYGELLSSSKTLKEIAADSGYANVFYFSRVFKKRFATRPGAVRRRGLIP